MRKHITNRTSTTGHWIRNKEAYNTPNMDAIRDSSAQIGEKMEKSG